MTTALRLLFRSDLCWCGVLRASPLQRRPRLCKYEHPYYGSLAKTKRLTPGNILILYLSRQKRLLPELIKGTNKNAKHFVDPIVGCRSLYRCSSAVPCLNELWEARQWIRESHEAYMWRIHILCLAGYCCSSLSSY